MARWSSSTANRDGGHCTWPRAISLFILCIIVGVLIWQLVPWDDIIGGILPDFNTTGPIDVLEKTMNPSVMPSMAPSLGPIPFSECTSDDIPCCNGLESNCEMHVNDLMYAASHNAMSSVEDKFSGPNHFKSLEESLEAGYRAFLLDLCDCGVDGLQFCHTICRAGKRDPVALLENLVTFLNNNLEEVVLLVFQIGREFTGKTPIDLNELHSIMKTVPGFVDMIYLHPSVSSSWPTMQSLIDLGQRIIIFHHEASDCTTGDCPAGFNYYFQHTVETSYSFKSVMALRDHSTSCALGFGAGGNMDFYGVNNFVTLALPNSDFARVVNQKDFLEEHISECETITGMSPNFISVDFWSIGQVPAVVQSFNKKRANKR